MQELGRKRRKCLNHFRGYMKEMEVKLMGTLMP